MYFALTAVQPVSAIDRLSNDSVLSPDNLNTSIEYYLSNVVMVAMSLQSENRFQNIRDFKNAISVKPTIIDHSIPVIKKRPMKNSIFLILGIAIVALLVGVLFMLSNKKENVKLTANFEIPSHSLAGEIVALEQLSTGENLEYVWEFDGANINTSTDESPQIIYREEGDYKIKLVVKNEEGIETSSEKIIRVENESKNIPGEKNPVQTPPNPVVTQDENTNRNTVTGKSAENNLIDVMLAMPQQNYFTWSELIATNGLKTILLIKKIGSSLQISEEVTGKSSYKFKSGDTRFDGVNCEIELIVESNDKVKLKGKNKLREKTTC